METKSVFEMSVCMKNLTRLSAREDFIKLRCRDSFKTSMIFRNSTRTVLVLNCTGFWSENLRERGHLIDPGLDGRIILRRIFRKLDVVFGLAKDRARWRALVNAVMNLRVP
jgi:ribosomal protein S27E